MEIYQQSIKIYLTVQQDATFSYLPCILVEVWKFGGLEAWTGFTLRGYHKGHKEPQRDTKKIG